MNSIQTVIQSPSGLAESLLIDQLVKNHSLKFVVNKAKNTSSRFDDIVDPAWELIRHYADKDGENGIFSLGNNIIKILKWYNSEYMQVMVVGDEKESVHSLCDNILNSLKPIRIVPSDEVNVSFWSQNTMGGASMRNRKILAPQWDNIKKNYASTTRQRLESLMTVKPPLDNGRLVLFHSSPGCGKTFVIRSLLQKWLPWADAHYIVDPEAMFTNSSYLLSVITQDQEGYIYEDEEEEIMLSEGTDRYKILILEDADEFLRQDAKRTTGQALSRLLNIADGLIGQGLNLLILITTNEDLKNIHPAVQRVGRCLANIPFEKFTPVEANKWLEGNNVVKEEKSLAELYELIRDKKQIKTDKVVASTGQYL